MAVLDACVLIPAALRDLLLSCANVGVFRPIWQDEILNEVKRNGSRLLVERSGLTELAALAAVEYTLGRMSDAFPDAVAASSLWVPLVPDMTCDQNDRHVLAVAVGANNRGSARGADDAWSLPATLRRRTARPPGIVESEHWPALRPPAVIHSGGPADQNLEGSCGTFVAHKSENLWSVGSASVNQPRTKWRIATVLSGLRSLS